MARVYDLDAHRPWTNFSVHFSVSRKGEIEFILDGLNYTPASCDALGAVMRNTADAIDDIGIVLSVSNDNRISPPVSMA